MQIGIFSLHMSEATARKIVVRLPMNPTANDVQRVWCQLIAEDEALKNAPIELSDLRREK